MRASQKYTLFDYNAHLLCPHSLSLTCGLPWEMAAWRLQRKPQTVKNHWVSFKSKLLKHASITQQRPRESRGVFPKTLETNSGIQKKHAWQLLDDMHGQQLFWIACAFECYIKWCYKFVFPTVRRVSHGDVIPGNTNCSHSQIKFGHILLELLWPHRRQAMARIVCHFWNDYVTADPQPFLSLGGDFLSQPPF